MKRCTKAILAIATLASTIAACFALQRHVHFDTFLNAESDANARFNQVQQKTIHNAYAQALSIRHLLDAGARSLEIDAHIGKRGHDRMTRDWFVYHVDIPLFDSSSCPRLSECLDAVASFHEKNRGHFPITLFLDLKDPFEGDSHSPDDIDALVRSRFDAASLYTPGNLQAACPGAVSLSEAVRAPCSWPTVGSMRDKIVVVLTGGTACGGDSRLATYVEDGKRAADRLAFVAPNVDEGCGITTYTREKPFAIFFNMSWPFRHLAGVVRDLGMIGRVYYGGTTGGLDDPETWNEAKRQRAHFLATDEM